MSMVRMEKFRRDRRWWTIEPDNNVHEELVTSIIELIARDQRRESYADWRALYEDVPSPGLVRQGRSRRHRHNLIQSLVDAAHSKQIKQRPKPQILTTEGSTIEQRKAKDLTDWVEGEFERLDFYESFAEVAAMESKLVGSGFVKVFAHDDKPALELCYAEDIFVDPREQKHGCVRTLYHARSVDKYVLADMYPKHREKILKAPLSALDAEEDVDGAADMADLILVIEAWRLPASKNTPGRHAICIENCTLRFEEYTKSKFPFRKLLWKPRPRSFFGIGLVEGNAGTQAELNSLTQTISDAYALCVPIVIAPSGAQFDRRQVTNSVWAWYSCNADPNQIKVVVPNAIAPDFTQREDRLVARAFERERISQLSAQGQKPAGLNSGKALVVHNDMDNENHVVPNRAYERFCVEIGEAIIECAEDIVREAEEARERGEDVKIPELTVYSGKNALRKIDFSDVRFGEEPMIMRAFPVSALASSPQARYEQITEQMQAGLLSREQALMLLDNPDVDGWSRREFADRRLVDKILDDAMAHGTSGAHAVSRFMNLQYARKQAWLAYNEAHLIGAPQGHLDAIEEICGAIETEIQNMEREKAEAMAAATAAAQPAPNPAAPGPMMAMPPPTAPLPMPGAA